MKKITVLGMQLTDYSVREALARTEVFLKSGTLNLILYLSAKELVDARLSERERYLIERADLTLYSDLKTLRKAGISDRNRRNEVVKGEYIKTFLKKVADAGYSICLLAEDSLSLDNLENNLCKEQETLNICGRYVATEDMDVDALMNELNMLNPTVVMSDIPTCVKRSLLPVALKYLNAEVWLEFNQQVKINQNPRKIMSKKIVNLWYHILLRLHIGQYRDNEKSRK